MYASSSTSSVSELFHEFHSRRLLLLHSPPSSSTTHNETSSDSYLGNGNFDANVVMVLSVLLCALICSLGLNSIIRCALRCSTLVLNDPNTSTSNPPPRVANTGIKKKALKTFPIVTFSADSKLPGLDTECVICLSEFSDGDRLRILPKCNHGFHVRCIDKWLSSHSSCPKCRHCLIETCQKIVGSSSSSSNSQSSVPETIVRIQPLEPEGLVRNYRDT